MKVGKLIKFKTITYDQDGEVWRTDDFGIIIKETLENFVVFTFDKEVVELDKNNKYLYNLL